MTKARDPAPTVAFSPIVTPQRMVAPLPMEAPLLTKVGTTSQSSSDWGLPSSFTARGYLSLIKQTPCPMNTSSSIVTPSHMNV